jgi:UDP:flavonoid glycosyltransferase YjiC (YdhE family)
MRALGFEAAPIDPRIEQIPLGDSGAPNRLAAIRRSAVAIAARGRLDGPDLAAAIAGEDPDTLLVDVNAWGALAAAEAWGGPWACLAPFPLPLPDPGLPPFGPGLPPAAGPLGRLRDRVGHRLTDGLATRMLGPRVNELRAGLDLPPLARAEEMLARPPLLLYTTAEPFEYPRRHPPSNLLMVGPCDWDPGGPTPPGLEAIEAPLILLTTSSEPQADQRLLRVALEALADQPVHLLATMPAGIPDDLVLPANATVLRYAPHSVLLPRCACAITHGGMGATQKALARGVPVCAVPFGRDQFEVARRAEVAGAGSRLPAWRLSARRLRAKVREAGGMRAGAERVAAGYRGAGGAVAAAAAIEALIEQS